MEQLRPWRRAARATASPGGGLHLQPHLGRTRTGRARQLQGDPEYSDYYWIYPDRTMPTPSSRTCARSSRTTTPVPSSAAGRPLGLGHVPHLPVGPELRQPGRVPGRWPGEMLFIANQGVDILRMDAVAFIWKQLGTTCENLPEAHFLLRAYNAVAGSRRRRCCSSPRRSCTPTRSALYIRPGECQLSYNPLQMALIWNSLATRDVEPAGAGARAAAQHARRHVLGQLRAQPRRHRLDLRRRGRRRARHQRLRPPPVPEPRSTSTGTPAASRAACRSRTTRAPATAASAARRPSLCGMEDEPDEAVARILLAHSRGVQHRRHPAAVPRRRSGAAERLPVRLEDGHGTDSRWVHRPHYPAEQYARRHETRTPEGCRLRRPAAHDRGHGPRRRNWRARG